MNVFHALFCIVQKGAWTACHTLFTPWKCPLPHVAGKINSEPEKHGRLRNDWTAAPPSGIVFAPFLQSFKRRQARSTSTSAHRKPAISIRRAPVIASNRMMLTACVFAPCSRSQTLHPAQTVQQRSDIIRLSHRDNASLLLHGLSALRHWRRANQPPESPHLCRHERRRGTAIFPA